jgi:serine protease Do
MQEADRTGNSPPVPGPAPYRWPVTMVVLTSMVLTAGLVGLYFAPEWAVRWRRSSDQAAADAAYLKRQAELKAESDVAAERVANLDDRVHLVSLGFREVARKVAPMVVHIGNEVEVPEPVVGRTFYDLETGRHYLERAEGSGILVKPGYVLTNEHVVRNAQRLRVTFASGRWLMAATESVSVDRTTDLAVVRLPHEKNATFDPDYAVTADFADSDKDIQVGDWVLAAGSPFGLKQTLTAGIISAKGRVEIGILQNQVELLQTDAAINPGNSGGPLFDQKGRVVGVNVAIASDNGRNEGVGFAIPSNAAQEIFQQLVDKGEVVRGFVGIFMQEIPPGMESRVGLTEGGGVVVYRVEANSPADRAGIRKGDVIVGYGGQPLGSANPLNQLRRRIARTPPEKTVAMEIARRNQRLTVEVTIAKRPTV